MRSTCKIEGCDGFVVGQGLCRLHYSRQYRGAPLDGTRKNARQRCIVEGCERWRVSNGLCDNHRPRPDKRREKVDLVCSHCGLAFKGRRHTTSGDGSVRFCSRDCKSRYRVASGKGTQASLKSYYKRRYGLTLEEAETMRANGCTICGTTVWPGRHAQGHIDHDHITGRVRGVLCSECNTGLGKFRDDPALLEAAAAYLRR